MKRLVRVRRLVLAAALVLPACHGDAGRERRLIQLREAIGSQPLDEAAAAKLSAEKEELDRMVSDLMRHGDRKRDARHDWLIGEGQRLRFLFDEPGAWEESERRLNLALARKPAYVAAHVSLGQLFLTGGFENAPRAEREFVRAIEGSGGQPPPEAIKGLFLAYYYQGRWSEALRESERFLAVRPGDVDVEKMRAMAETNLAGKTGAKK